MHAPRRPLSPHLQVYRLPPTALLSITHRITGFLLALGIIALIAWLAAIAAGKPIYKEVHEFFVSLPGRTLLVTWSAMLYFHLCAGVRHLLWDAGRGFELRAVDIGAVLALIATVVLTVLTWQTFRNFT